MAGENPALTINGDITMDEDIRFTINIAGVAGGAGAYTAFPCPYRCTVRDLTGVVNISPGTGDTVTVTNATQGTTVGVMTWAGVAAINSLGAWVADTTDGDTVCAEDDVLVFTTSVCTNAACFTLALELDPKCRVA